MVSEGGDRRHDAPADEEAPKNPTDEQLEVEGPNESAPGHEPSGEEPERREGPRPSSER